MCSYLGPCKDLIRQLVCLLTVGKPSYTCIHSWQGEKIAEDLFQNTGDWCKHTRIIPMRVIERKVITL